MTDSVDRIRAALRQWKADLSQVRKDFFVDFARHRANARAITRAADATLEREMARIARRFPTTNPGGNFEGEPLDYRGGDLVVKDPFEELAPLVRSEFSVPSIEDALDVTNHMEQSIRNELDAEQAGSLLRKR